MKLFALSGSVLFHVAEAAARFLAEPSSPNEALNGERRNHGHSATPGFDGRLVNLRNRNDIFIRHRDLDVLRIEPLRRILFRRPQDRPLRKNLCKIEPTSIADFSLKRSWFRSGIAQG
jgi:hypothetical protein